MMLESQTAAEKLGVRFLLDVDRRIDGGGEVGAHKTSMLQDLERGRPTEINALLGAAVELAGLAD
jgi:2-dehydropantoate 2-reductase